MSEQLAFHKLRLLAQIRMLWRRAARGLAEMLPKGLYKRSLLIVICADGSAPERGDLGIHAASLGFGDPQAFRGGRA